MIVSKSKIRIRYDEVDKMGYVYHGNYAKYYHISRTELLRKIGICDSSMETYNILMPVVDISIKYLNPIFYDEIIVIKTIMLSIPTSRMKFSHEVYNQKNEIINKAESTVAFVNIDTRKPIRPSKIILDKIQSYIETQNY